VVALVVYESTVVALAVVKLPVLAVVAPIAVPSMYPPVIRAFAVLNPVVATKVVMLPFVALMPQAVMLPVSTVGTLTRKLILQQ